jgi:hypothetical protein
MTRFARFSIPVVSLVLALSACANQAQDPCRADALEPDFETFGPLAGPAVDPASGALRPGAYVISTTYLRLRSEPAAQAKFGELMEGIRPALFSADGLLAVQLGASAMCGTARTLGVWRDEAAMYEFVVGPAHEAAILSVGQVSRGGSIVMHRAGDDKGATFPAAIQMLANHPGPQY